jgi:hypothetical protein
MLPDLLAEINRQGGYETGEGPAPVVSLELFFEGNDDLASIGCNLTDHPGVPHFFTVLRNLRDRAEAQEVRVLCPERGQARVGRVSRSDAARKMKVWPFGVARRRVASNHLMLRWLKTVVVSDEEKASVRRQVGIRKTNASESLLTCRKDLKTTSEPGCHLNPGISLAGVPLFWPGGVRHADDVSLICGFRVELGKACSETARIVFVSWAIGSFSKRGDREG